MAFTRIHHHTFTVSDMDRSLKFWRGALGFTGVQFNSTIVDMVREGNLAAQIVYAFDPDNIVEELYQLIP